MLNSNLDKNEVKQIIVSNGVFLETLNEKAPNAKLLNVENIYNGFNI